MKHQAERLEIHRPGHRLTSVYLTTRTDISQDPTVMSPRPPLLPLLCFATLCCDCPVSISYFTLVFLFHSDGKILGEGRVSVFLLPFSYSSLLGKKSVVQSKELLVYKSTRILYQSATCYSMEFRFVWQECLPYYFMLKVTKTHWNLSQPKVIHTV